MNYKIRLELWLPGKTEPVIAKAEDLDENSIGYLAESLRREIANRGKKSLKDQALKHLDSIATEWTNDFLHSI